ncbi:MAG: DUF1997 domain-containing protein [Cyanobacteria bacterium J06639_1]
MSIASSNPVAKSQSESDPVRTTDRDTVRLLVNQSGWVEMDTEREPLAVYLRQHPKWVARCFKPLKVEQLCDRTYRLQFFRMGGLGFNLEPCFGIEILPDEDYLFALNSIELPTDEGLPYHVDCYSSFLLEERQPGETIQTRVNWELKLDIQMQLPGFLLALPRKQVLAVGQGVVNQVARSMCKRLTRNICTDYDRYRAAAHSFS